MCKVANKAEYSLTDTGRRDRRAHAVGTFLLCLRKFGFAWVLSKRSRDSDKEKHLPFIILDFYQNNSL